MSAPSSRRPSVLGTSTPPALQSPRLELSSSFSVEPKSEYLRNALEARRAKDAATPSPVEARPTPKRINTTVSPASDPWIDQAVSEEEVPRVTPIRRSRRPSEGAHPRLPTQRELQSESETLKNNLFNLNLKLELLKKQNNELKDSLETANRRIEDMEPLEDENYDLREDNDRLRLRMQNLEEENVELRDANSEILTIQDETIANLEKQHTALNEAADFIFQLEKEKEDLKKANTQLQEQTMTIGQFSIGVDGHSSDRYPGRIHSIDDSRPSTSHFDSDYYSQPGSPQVKVKTSQDLEKHSERARSILEMKIDGKKSVQELKKRVSDASIKHKARPKSPTPEVPRIPENYSEAYRGSRPQRPIVRTPSRAQRKVAPPTLLEPSSSRPGTATPRTPTGPKEGLRGLFREAKTFERSRPSSSHQSPSTSRRPGTHSEVSSPSQSIAAPPRHSSRFAPTSSNERLRGSSSSEMLQTDTAPSEVSLPPPPTIDTEDLISEPDPREKWWKDVRRVYPHASSSIIAMNGMRGKPSDARVQRDFFFNGAEDEEQFMQRAHGYLPKRK